MEAIAILGLWNLVVFRLFAHDKKRARRKGRRISERMLLSAALLGGGAGALAAMQFLRHKTNHVRFRVLVPLGCVVTLTLTAWLLVLSQGQ